MVSADALFPLDVRLRFCDEKVMLFLTNLKYSIVQHSKEMLKLPSKDGGFAPPKMGQ